MLDYPFNLVVEELYKVHKLYNQFIGLKQPKITPEQGKLLYVLMHKKMNQKELAKALHITEATLSVRIKRLLDMGYIERSVNQNDKRVYSIVLSAKGKDEVNEIKEHMKYYHQLITKGITVEEVETILNVIKKVQKNIEEGIEC